MCETFTPAAEVEVRRVMAALESGLAALYPDWPTGCCVHAAAVKLKVFRGALQSAGVSPSSAKAHTLHVR